MFRKIADFYIGCVRQVVLVLLLCLAVGNIPTALYTAIYLARRGKYRRRAQMKKMDIQDL